MNDAYDMYGNPSERTQILDNMEQRLTEYSVFWTRKLWLYRDVPISDLTWNGSESEPGDPAEACCDRFDLLICRDDRVLMGLVVYTDELGWDEQVTEFLFRPGRVNRRILDWSSDLDELFGNLEAVSCAAHPSYWRYRPRLIPPEAREALLKKGLLKKRRMFGVTVWAPTAYGAALDIIRGRQVVDKEWTGESPFCTEAALSRLRVEAAWEPDMQPRQTKPLADRLARLQRGLPCTDAYAAAAVKVFADMPLEAYMAGCSEHLAFLTEHLGAHLSYMDAAVSIGNLLRRPEQRKLGQELLSSLAEPLYQICRKGRYHYQYSTQ